MRVEKFGNLTFYNCDNMEIMKNTTDKYYDLAIVDLEYNIGASKPSVKPILTKQKNGSLLKVKNTNNYTSKNWDFKKSDKTYFDELFRISKNQIIWGGNYYGLEGGYLIWDKINGDCDQFDCEMAWISKTKRTDIVRYMWQGMFQGVYCGKDIKKAIIQQGNKQLNEDRIHPTQKPVALYKWLLKNYAKQGDKILDTHLGSNSIGIAIDEANQLDKMNFQFTGIELDEEYFEKSIKRFKEYKSQYKLF